MSFIDTLQSFLFGNNKPQKQQGERIPMPPPRQDLVKEGYTPTEGGSYQKPVSGGTRVIFPEKISSPTPTPPPAPMVTQAMERLTQTSSPKTSLQPNSKMVFEKDQTGTWRIMQKSDMPNQTQPLQIPKEKLITPSPSPWTQQPSVLGKQQGQKYGRDPEIRKYTITPEVENAIVKAANTYNLPPDLLFDIAKAESGFSATSAPKGKMFEEAGNPQGLFQFVGHTWEDVLRRYNNKPGMSLRLPNEDRFDPETNAMAAAYLIANGQLGKWTASKHSWGKFWSEEELAPYYSQTIGYKGRK